MFWMKTAALCLGLAGVAGIMPAQEILIPGFAPQAAAPAAPATPRARTVSIARPSVSYLGVGLYEVTDERAKALNMKETYGVEVKRVEENSPAAKAGVKEGDVIVDLNGQRIEGVEQFIRMIGETPVGRKVNIGLLRNASTQHVAATLELRKGPATAMMLRGMPSEVMAPLPSVAPMLELEREFGDLGSRFSVLSMSNNRLGIEAETLTSQLADFFGVKSGILVRSVTAKSAAEKAGVKAGDVITKVNGTPVMSPREITGAVRNAGKGKVAFTVVRNKRETTLELEVPEAKLSPMAAPVREVL